ncbi:hypothetical protein LN650_23820 [Klebsiella pneumoniae subsp. pneumoniae]|nr:hypothetical protein [Klebsiella pneumoniae subsp. pneumoniae]
MVAPGLDDIVSLDPAEANELSSIQTVPQPLSASGAARPATTLKNRDRSSPKAGRLIRRRKP